MRKLMALTLSVALIAMGLCVSVGAQNQQQQEKPGQQQQEQPGQQQQQQGASIHWGNKRVSTSKPKSPPKKHNGGGVVRQGGGGLQQQQQQTTIVRVEGKPGEPGKNGSSCSVRSNGNGTSTVSCTDGTSAIIKDGEDGSSCSVTSNGNGTSTLACTDGTSILIHDGKDGYTPQKGVDYFDGKPGRNGICSSKGCKVAVVSTAAVGGGIMLACIFGFKGLCRAKGPRLGPIVTALPPGPGLH